MKIEDVTIGMVVKTHNMTSCVSLYDRSFDNLTGIVKSIREHKSWGDIAVRVAFLPGQKRKWGLFAPCWLKPADLLDVIAKETR